MVMTLSLYSYRVPSITVNLTSIEISVISKKKKIEGVLNTKLCA